MAANPLVRARVNGVEKNVGAAYASVKGLTVLDEPTHRDDGSPRTATRKGGRKIKPKTSVAEEVAKKSAEKKAADVAVSNPAAGQLRPDTKEIDPA